MNECTEAWGEFVGVRDECTADQIAMVERVWRLGGVCCGVYVYGDRHGIVKHPIVLMNVEHGLDVREVHVDGSLSELGPLSEVVEAEMGLGV